MTHLTLSELSATVEQVLLEGLEPTYWVQAEIASLSTRNGHAYLELVENTKTGGLTAKYRATCWASTYRSLAAYFTSETGSTLQAGMQILIEVEVSLHAVYGLSLNIIDIDPSYTLGDLARQRQQTILKLQQDGVWDLQRTLTLPTLVARIAIISSHQAAGYEDFTHQLQQSGFAFATTLFPATMQGDNASKSIQQALTLIADQYESFDAVVLIRGGGASTDLGCFDDYMLASHCAQFPLPILSGIGHTRDISITDMVVHTSLKTPTAVAAFLIERFTTQQERLTQLRIRLSQTAERQIILRRHRIEMLRQMVQMLSPERIYEKGYSLMTCKGKIISSITELHTGDTLSTHLKDGIVTSIAE